jgi:hypothetical protein
MEGQVKGRALLLIDNQITKMAPVKIETPTYGRIGWGLMEMKELFDLWKSFLLLPEQYAILGVYFDAMKQMWALVLESKELPPVKVNMEPRHLLPVYWIDEDGTVGISEMKLMDW